MSAYVHNISIDSGADYCTGMNVEEWISGLKVDIN